MNNNSDNEKGSVIKLKRKRNIAEWRSVKNKKLKASGLEYNTKKETKAARATGAKCRLGWIGEIIPVFNYSILFILGVNVNV